MATHERTDTRDQVATRGQVATHDRPDTRGQIATHDLTKVFRRDGREIAAVSGVSLTLEPGTITAVIGPSGSGKSSLLSIVAGLLKPTSGTVTIGGRDLYAVSDRERCRIRNDSIGVIPQGRCELANLTVWENVLLPASLYADDQREYGERADYLLWRLGLSALMDSLPQTLSGGELRRMSIARGLLREPAVVLADEPTNDLDEESIRTVLELFREAAEGGASVLLVTHEREVLPAADQVLRMEGGILS